MENERLDRLEREVERLASLIAGQPDMVPATEHWLIDTTLERYPRGAIVYGGHLPDAPGPVRWQIDRDGGSLAESDWSAAATCFDALAHPMRLRLLQLVLAGHQTTADLAEAADTGTTGQLHHHLRQLVAAGWLASTGRGRYAVPPQRIIPLLTAISLATS